MTSRDLKFRALLDAARFNSEAARMRGELGRLDSSTTKSTGAMGLLSKGAALVGGAFAAAKLGQFVTDSVQLAVAAEDAGTKFDAVFGPAVDKAQQFVDEFANKAGFAEHEMQDMLATTGNVAQGLGATADESLTLATSLATMAGDVASFNGATKDTPAVLAAMQSALTGEREALKTYGIVINEADVQAQAFTETGKTQASELTKLEKAQATLTLITQRANAAVGDLDRTAEGTSNTSARLAAEFEDLQVKLGTALIPILGRGLDALNDLAIALDETSTSAEEFGSKWTIASTKFHEALPGTQAGEKAWLAAADSFREFTGAVDEGDGVFRALVDAVASIATTGDLATATLGEFREATGVSAQATQDAASYAVEHAEALGLTSEQLEILADWTKEANAESNRQIAAFDSGTAEAQRFARIGLKAAEDAQEDLTEATEDTRTALQKLLDKQRAAIDPLFAFTQATRDLEDAEKDVNRARNEFGRGSPEHIKAMENQAVAYLDLKGAAETLRLQGIAPTREAFRVLAIHAGLTEDQIRLMEQQWDLWTPKSKTLTLTKSGDGWSTGGGGNDFMAAGGPVRRGRRYIVGERGPEMFVPPGDGTIIPNNDLTAVTSGGGVVSAGPQVIQFVVNGRIMEEMYVQGKALAERKGRG